jgi:hypothetical protein
MRFLHFLGCWCGNVWRYTDDSQDLAYCLLVVGIVPSIAGVSLRISLCPLLVAILLVKSPEESSAGHMHCPLYMISILTTSAWFSIHIWHKTVVPGFNISFVIGGHDPIWQPTLLATCCVSSIKSNLALFSVIYLKSINQSTSWMSMHCDGRPVLNPSRDCLRISGPSIYSDGESTITKVSRPAHESSIYEVSKESSIIWEGLKDASVQRRKCGSMSMWLSDKAGR